MVGPNRLSASALSQLFSASVYKAMATRGESKAFARLAREMDLPGECGAHLSVAEAFDAAFAALGRIGQRDEYVYKTALVRKILLGRHSLKTASLLSEFRAGDCKVDLAILNGTSTAYEIKSERDSLSRLCNQVENYRKVFASVYVIASESHVAGVLGVVPADVGVLSLSSRARLAKVRAAMDRPERLCPATVFESLRVSEAKSVLLSLGVEFPDLPNTLQHAALREAFQSLDPVAVHASVVRTLKQTRSGAPLTHLVSQLPPSLHANGLTIRIPASSHSNLLSAMRTSLGESLHWA